MARVLIEEEGSPTRSFRLVTDAVSIGRSDAADLVLPDADVSRKHALLIRERDGWVIEDQKSANGISVNGTTAERAALAHGDVIVVGKFKVVFQSDDEGDQAEYTGPSVEGHDEMTIPGIPIADIQAAMNLASAPSAADTEAPAPESAAPEASAPVPAGVAESSGPVAPHLIGTEGERYDLDGKILRFGQDIPVQGAFFLGSPGDLLAKDGGWLVRKGFFLTPLEVNGKSASSQRLKSGDRIRIGTSRFTYYGP